MTALATLLGQNVRTYEGGPHKWDELLGIELEIEDPAYPPHNPSGYLGSWTAHEDHSLRNGIEYYTAAPMGGEQLQRAVATFYDSGIRYTNGPRTSTHIHINMTDVDDTVLKSLVMIMYMVEDALYAAVEESRKWGGYSVSLKEMAPSRLRALLNPQHDRQFIGAICPARNHERYYGLNTNLRRHGTVEFRYFPGGPSRTDLESWIDFVVLTKKAARRLTPEELMARINGPEDVVSFLNEHYGEWASKLLENSSPDSLYQSFMEVEAMAGDEHGPELGNNLVFLSERLLGFVIHNILQGDEEAGNYLRAGIGNAAVLAKPDWGYYITQARAVSRRNKMLAERAEAGIPVQPDESIPDMDEGVSLAYYQASRPYGRVTVEQSTLDMERRMNDAIANLQASSPRRQGQTVRFVDRITPPIRRPVIRPVISEFDVNPFEDMPPEFYETTPPIEVSEDNN